MRKQESPSGTTVLEAHGSLTDRDVAILRQLLASDRASLELIVDLRGVQAPLAPVLLDLAVVVGDARGRLRLLGLTGASERLLKMLGIRLDRGSGVAPESAGAGGE
ncbi:MAG: hypothetical protein WB493_12200 [Anaeromyxobacteraceae bacterium]